MDFDGDKILATWNAIIVNAIRNHDYFLYDKGVQSEKVENNWESRLSHFLKTSAPDRTGYITNLATKWTDLKWNYELIGRQDIADSYDNCVKALRFLQGWEIDSAKTGKSAEDMGFPKQLKIKVAAEHFIGMRELQDRAMNAESSYHSSAPLGVLYDYVQEFKKNHTILKNAQDRSYYIARTFSAEERKVIQALNERIRPIEKAYCAEVGQLYALSSAGVYSKGDVSALMDRIRDRYHDLLQSMVSLENGITEDIVAFSAYYVTNDKNGNVSHSRTFPWNCYFSSMIRLLYRNNNKTFLYRLPRRKDEEEQVCSIRNNWLLLNGEPCCYVNAADSGSIPVIYIDGDAFAMIPQLAPTYTKRAQEAAEIVADRKTYAIAVNGFRQNGCEHCEDFLARVAACQNKFQIVDDNGFARISAGGKVIANLASKEIAAELVGHTFTLISHSGTTRIPKRMTANTVMKNDVEAYNGQINLECATETFSGLKADTSFPTGECPPATEVPEEYYQALEASYEAYYDSYESYCSEDDFSDWV